MPGSASFDPSAVAATRAPAPTGPTGSIGATAATDVHGLTATGATGAATDTAAPKKKARAKAPANTENFVRLDMRRGVAPGLRGKRNKKPKGQWRLKQVPTPTLVA